MDATWFRDINHFQTQTVWLHGFMRWMSLDGIILCGVVLVIGYLIARRMVDALRRVAADVWAGGAAVAAVGVAQPIADTVDRTRPFVAMPHVHLLIQHARDYGFPSDHATAAGAVAAGLFLVNRWLGVVGTLLAGLIAFSRVYVGVHYPGDVAGGLALGAAVALLGALVAVPLLRRVAGWLARTPLRPLVAAPWARIRPY